MTYHQPFADDGGLSALVYCRISSVSQAKKGDGLRSQETRCREFCKYMNLDVARVFYDRAVSGRLVDRPGIKELLQFLRRSKSSDRFVVVFDDISRLARDMRAYFDLRDAIIETGAQMACPTLEFREDSDGRYFEGLQALNAEHYRRKNAEQTKARMRARMMNGYWCFAAPPGYVYKRMPDHGNLLVRDEPLATVYQQALEGFASGRLGSQAEVKRFLEDQPVFTDSKKSTKVTFEDVARLLTRPHYAGMIERPEWGVTRRKGHHEPLISVETYEKVQARIAEGSRVPARADINADFPLRGFVCCADCDKPLTANWSKSKTGKRHPYYLCFNKDCVSYRKSIRREDVEGAFEGLLQSMRPSQKLFHYVSVIFKTEWDRQLKALGAAHKALRADILKLEQDISKFMDRLVDAESDTAVTAYERRIEKLETEKLLKTEKLQTSLRPQRRFDEMFELAMGFLANPWKIWDSPRLEDKRTVLKLAFEGPLAYCRNEGLRTPKTTLPFKVLAGNGGAKQEMAERASV